MNIMIVAAGVEQGFAVGGSGITGVIAVAGFAAAGVLLLFTAGRLLRRQRCVPHAAHYAATRL